MGRLHQSLLATAAALMVSTSMAQAAKLTFYCSAQEDWCQSMARGFEEATGIDVNMTRKSSGETFAQIKAEESQSKRRCLVGRNG